MVIHNKTVNVNGNIAFSQYSFLKPGQIKDPGDVPDGWVFEYRSGVDEYQRMYKGKLLRIRKSSAKVAAEQFFTYIGSKYLGAPYTLAEAVTLAMGKENAKIPKTVPGMAVEQQTSPEPEKTPAMGQKPVDMPTD